MTPSRSPNFREQSRGPEAGYTHSYRGHLTTKSRRYSTVMGTLRATRASWTHQQAAEHSAPQERPATYGPVRWEVDEAGHSALSDRTLVVSAALRHVGNRRTRLTDAFCLRDKRCGGR